MEDWRRKKIEDVYSKWERKSRPPNPKNVSFKQVQTGMTTSRGTSTNGSSNGTARSVIFTAHWNQYYYTEFACNEAFQEAAEVQSL